MSDETSEAPTELPQERAQEQAQEQAHSGGPPAFLTGAKGWITGLTSMAIAVTAMVAAFGNLFGSDKEIAAPQAAVSAPAAGATPAAASAAGAEEEGLPTVYTGDKTRIEWNGKAWELSSADGHFTYEEMLSPADNMVLAFDKQEGEYLRWPIAGGTVEYSADDRQSWITYAEVTPADES